MGPGGMLVFMENERLFSSTELMRAADCTRKALRVYQSRGLIKPVCDVGNRRYDKRALERLKLVVSLRAIDLSLDEIATVLTARDAATGGDKALAAAGEVRHLLARLDERIAGLIKLREELSEARTTLEECSPCPRPVSACGDCATEGKLQSDAARTLLMHTSPPA